MRGNGCILTGVTVEEAIVMAFYLEEAAKTELAVIASGQEENRWSIRTRKQKAARFHRVRYSSACGTTSRTVTLKCKKFDGSRLRGIEVGYKSDNDKYGERPWRIVRTFYS